LFQVLKNRHLQKPNGVPMQLIRTVRLHKPKSPPWRGGTFLHPLPSPFTKQPCSTHMFLIAGSKSACISWILLCNDVGKGLGAFNLAKGFEHLGAENVCQGSCTRPSGAFSQRWPRLKFGKCPPRLDLWRPSVKYSKSGTLLQSVHGSGLAPSLYLIHVSSISARSL
jgi:hypothetical protein